MFSIYGVNGQVVNGSLGAMNRVHQPAKSRHGRGVATNGEELGVEATVTEPYSEAIRTYRDMLHHDLERGPVYQASQVMHGPVITIKADEVVARAWQTLHRHHIHQAPVLDDTTHLVGMVSERDLLTAIDIDGEEVIETTTRRVRDVMKTPVVSADPSTDIRRIASVMLEYGVDGVPIADATGKLIGFISRTDILRAVITDPPLSVWR